MAEIAPLPIELQPWQARDNTMAMGGSRQWIYRFANGYGASVIQGPHTYGGKEDLYEIAVAAFDGDDWEITYETPVADDVLGWQSLADVAAVLAQIAGLAKA